ncbi:uncharacterized protein [Bemisia tabaci]|uniref:uncharacterized protein n=1 Tax=Bemisia tabaci TaxID=7038 RepID=UPI003B27CD8A
MHWLIINVPGCWLPGGQEIIPYQKPANPTKEGEVHKIVALIYQQPDGIMNVTESSLTSDELVAGMRHAFRIRKFAQHYNLMFPFAMNFFLAEYKDPKIPLPGQKRPQQQNQQKKKKNQQQQQNRQQNPNQQIKHNQQKNQNQAQQKHQQNRDQQQLQNKQQQWNKPTTMQVQTEDDQKQIQRQQNKQQPQQPSQKRRQEQEHQQQQQQQKEQKQQRHQQQKQTPSDNLMDTFIAAQKQDFLNQQRQRNMEYQKQQQRQQQKQKQQQQQQQQQLNQQQQHSHHPSTSTHFPHEEEEEEVTLDSAELLRRQEVLDYYANKDNGITERVWIIAYTTDNPIRAIYMRDYQEKQRRKYEDKYKWPDPPSPTTKTTTATKTTTTTKTTTATKTTTTTVRTTRHKSTVASSTERDEWAGIMTMQMPIVPDMDEFEDYEGPRTRPGPSTTMHPIRARYLEDYEKKKHRKKHEKPPNGTTEKDEWAGIMTMQMPIVPDMDEFEDYEGPRTRPGPSTTMHPIRARYMQDYEEKRRKKKLGKNSENGQKTNKKQSE